MWQEENALNFTVRQTCTALYSRLVRTSRKSLTIITVCVHIENIIMLAYRFGGPISPFCIRQSKIERSTVLSLLCRIYLLFVLSSAGIVLILHQLCVVVPGDAHSQLKGTRGTENPIDSSKSANPPLPQNPIKWSFSIFTLVFNFNTSSFQLML